MKKIGIALLLICVLTFAVLTSCKKEESKGDDTTAQTTATVWHLIAWWPNISASMMK